MKLKYIICIIVLWISILPGMAQQSEPFFYESFDHSKVDIDSVKYKLKSTYSLLKIEQPVYTKGLVGKALNLTSSAPLRIPLCLEKAQCPSYDKEHSFSIQVWVQTLNGAQQGTPVMTNKQMGERDSCGWCIGTQENGAWYWNMSDGKTTYSYDPTPQRQKINDGKWHQIIVSVDRKKREVWMYLDGRNMAIYQLDDKLGSLESRLRTVVGGSDEYFDFDFHGEWSAFNGKIDEVKMWNRPLVASEVRSSYEQQMGITENVPIESSDRLKIQSWNILHGGHRLGQHVGVARTAEILKAEKADIIGLVETYGSGAIIADSLGYYFYLISDNLSIMSRFPIKSTIQLYKAFRSGGATLDLGENKELTFFDIWLDWRIDEYRATDIAGINTQLKKYASETNKRPVIAVGDFNSGSHLDKWPAWADNINNPKILWPSRVMQEDGFKDSYREMNINSEKDPGFTWTPQINHVQQDQRLRNRIDYIYYKGDQLVPYRSEVLDHHPVFWPSDHGSVVSYFYLNF